MLFVLLAAGCTRPPMRVAVVFDTTWKVLGETLDEGQQTIVKDTALATLRVAFADFDVRFVESAPQGPAIRAIRIEETPFARYGNGAIVRAGAVGDTFPVATISHVRLDALYLTELGLVGCRALTACPARPSSELLTAFGRGIGATAAHELGHQGGLEFSIDSRCDDCFDGHSAATLVHFFGVKHWSDAALARMRRVLPPRL